MATLDDYLKGLKDFEKKYESIVKDAIKQNEGKIIGMVKLRLFNTGIDGSGKLIGHYTQLSKDLKKLSGQRSSFITLRDTGNWYRSMFLDLDNDKLILNASNWKTSKLIRNYGESILEFTEAEQLMIVQTIIEPAIIKAFPEYGIVNIYDED